MTFIESSNMYQDIMSSLDKESYIPFVRENFGKISEREMARQLKIGKTTVNRWRKELGLKIIKNTSNESFFQEWSSEMSYILGYIFADGNIAWNPEKSYRSLTITASEKDIHHLEKMRKILKSTKELLYSANTRSYRLIVVSKDMCLGLMKLGVMPKKSLSVKFPIVPNKYLRDFIRGVMDGDGTVRYVNRKISPYFEIQIASGSEDFINSLANKITSIGIDAKPRKIKNNLYVLQYSCKRGLMLAEWLYKDSKLHLERKYQQYKKALEVKGGVMSHE